MSIGYSDYGDYVKAGKPRNTPNKPTETCSNCGGDIVANTVEGPYVTSWECENGCEPIEEG